MLSRPHAKFIVAFTVAILSLAGLTEAQTGGPTPHFIVSVASQDNPKVSLDCAPIPAGLVGWWPGELGPQDQMGQSDGEAKGNLSYRKGEVGLAFYYSNIIGFVKIPPFPELETADGVTLECWVCPSKEAEYPLIDWNDGMGQSGLHLWVFGGHGRMYLNMIDTQNKFHQLTSGLGIIKTDVFQHVAATYDRQTGIARLYRDGALMAEDNLGQFTPRTSYLLYLGHRPDDDHQFMGLIDEVSIYNRALTPDEIQSIYRAGSAGKGLTTAKATP